MSVETNISSSLNAPPLNHPSRVLFESAVKRGNIAVEYLARLDPFIENARSKTLLDADIYGEIEARQATLRSAIERAEQDRSTDSNHIYRLVAATETLEEMVYTPGIFAKTNSTREQRSDTTQHLAGTHTSLMQGALAELSSSKTKMDRQAHIGTINEQTFLAAINAAYHEDIAAIQSLAYQDYHRQTDSIVYLRTDNGFFEIPVQIKTADYRSNRTKGRLYVYMSEVNRNLDLSYGLIEYMNHGNLSDYARHCIDTLVGQVKHSASTAMYQRPLP